MAYRGSHVGPEIFNLGEGLFSMRSDLGSSFRGPPPPSQSSSSQSRLNMKYWKPGEDFLQNSLHFPSFKNLPHENSLQRDYWRPDRLGRFEPACVWFFMAEIINDEASQHSFLRNRVDVRDREGGVCPIFFYPKDLGDFDFKTLKTGKTIMVTNGQKHNFLDLSVGLRVEYLDSVSVIPCSMSDLFQLSNIYHAKKGTRCWSCGKQGISTSVSSIASSSTSSAVDNSSNGDRSSAVDNSSKDNASAVDSSPDGDCASAVGSETKLKTCAACKMAVYCCKDCQVKDWKEGHKRTCKAMPLFEKLTQIDFTTYDDRAFLRLT